MITLYNHFTAFDPFVYGTFFLVVFVWLGLGHPRGTSVRFAPLLAAAYALPLLGTSPMLRAMGLTSALFVVPCCVLVGEIVAWVGGLAAPLGVGQLRRRGAASAAPSRTRPSGWAWPCPTGTWCGSNRAYGHILGFEPEELVGKTIKEVTHPDDWEANAVQFDALVAGDIDLYNMEKRYLHADGHDGVGHGERQLRPRRRGPAHLHHRPDRRRDRAPRDARAPGPCGGARPAHRAPQPGPVHGPPGAGAQPGPARPPQRGAHVPRPRPLQAHQRQPRPRDGRPAPRCTWPSGSAPRCGPWTRWRASVATSSRCCARSATRPKRSTSPSVWSQAMQKPLALGESARCS